MEKSKQPSLRIYENIFSKYLEGSGTKVSRSQPAQGRGAVRRIRAHSLDCLEMFHLFLWDTMRPDRVYDGGLWALPEPLHHPLSGAMTLRVPLFYLRQRAVRLLRRC